MDKLTLVLKRDVPAFGQDCPCRATFVVDIPDGLSEEELQEGAAELVAALASCAEPAPRQLPPSSQEDT